jgi:hypothetical protein
MSRRRSKFVEALSAFALASCWTLAAKAQACCAGTGVVTPGRLALHEVALVGLQLKGASELGSFDSRGQYQATPSGASELALEQDPFAAVRVFERAQVALLVPFIQTRRTSHGHSEFGGGVGDINLNLRYDFTLAGASRVMPGIGALVGVTFPTGKPPDAADLGPLATGATGIGAYQASLGVAVEQAFGPWLLNLTGIVAARSARSVSSSEGTVQQRLAPQWTALAAVAYVFPGGAAVALSGSYATEGNTTINSQEVARSGHRLTTVTLGGLLPLSDSWRLQGTLFANPPLSGSSLNQTGFCGATFTVVRSWS